MRIATLNLWGRSGAWPDRRRVLADGFAALAPDAVALQEAEDREHVADVLGPEFDIVHRGEITIASRWPLGAVRELEPPWASDHFGLVAELTPFARPLAPLPSAVDVRRPASA